VPQNFFQGRQKFCVQIGGECEEKRERYLIKKEMKEKDQKLRKWRSWEEGS
jgi:hypothetical protein